MNRYLSKVKSKISKEQVTTSKFVGGGNNNKKKYKEEV